MITEILSPEIEREEEIVAELQRLGIRYLSRASNISPHQNRPPAKLIADLTRQPSSRVRNALIPLFLVKPEYAAYLREALTQVNNEQGLTLKFFYTAAVFLQRKSKTNPTAVLPDLFSGEIGVSGTNPDEKLRDLGQKQQEVSGRNINWQGTYENAAKHLFRQWELEKIWSK